MAFLWNLLWFIVALGMLITIHEFGHFWVARKCGVKVLRFSIGFGKPLYSRTDVKGTEYVVAGIPLGGYVRMLDSRVDDVSPENIGVTFDHKGIWQRIAIIAAGPIANLLFAVFAFFLFFMTGITSVKPIIGGVEEHSIAAAAGLQVDEVIVAINDTPTRDWGDVNLGIVDSIGHSQITLQVSLREAEHVSRTVVLNTADWTFDPDKQSTIASLGIKPFQPSIPAKLGAVADNSAAALGGLLVGDLITHVDQQRLEDWQQLVAVIQENRGEPMQIIVDRNGQQVQLDVSPKYDEKRQVRVMGISPERVEWPDYALIRVEYSGIEAVIEAFGATWQYISISISSLFKLITGDISIKNLSGPVSIAQGAGDTASGGLAYFLRFLAIISINLGVINLIPLPVLDGGHLFFFGIELIRGKPVSEKTQDIGYRIGAVILFLVMVVALTNDIARL